MKLVLLTHAATDAMPPPPFIKRSVSRKRRQIPGSKKIQKANNGERHEYKLTFEALSSDRQNQQWHGNYATVVVCKRSPRATEHLLP